MRSSVAITAMAALWLAGAACAIAADNLAEGQLLVSDRALNDPNLSRTVILIVTYNEDGAMGLVLNRRTDVPISRALKALKEAEGQEDPVFLGGPVDLRATFGLLRSGTQPRGAKRVAGVYVLSRQELLQETLAKKINASSFRVYLGYAGWGPGQLENEISLGAWHILGGDADMVFDADPDSLWSRLIHKTEEQVASAGRH